MNDLEIIMQSEMKRVKNQKETLDELQREQILKARKFYREMVEKLSFLEKYDCKVYLKDGCAGFYIDYNEHGYIKTASINLKWINKEYDGQRYSYCQAEERFLVNWHYNVCHNDGRDYITTEEIIKGLVKRIS